MLQDNNQLDDFFGLKSEKEGPSARHKEGIKDSLLKSVERNKLRLIPKVLSNKERYLIFIFALVMLGSVISIPFTSFYHYTTGVPDNGGSFTEGMVGEPRLINPLLSQSNDADRDLTSLIYSGLMKYNEAGKLIPDLAKSYEVSSDGLNYTIYLRDNVFWHDGTAVTADDVVFTVQTAQNPDYGSQQRVNWQGVETDKVNDYTIIFKLKERYAQFVNNFTIRILPKHAWQDIKPINFGQADLNLKPIGSGPYKFAKLKKDTLGRVREYELAVNEKFYLGRSHIDRIGFRFFDSEDAMIDAYNKNSIENISFVSGPNLKKIKFKRRLNVRELKMPRYFGVFFNQDQSKELADKNIRLALNHATDKNELLSKILEGKGESVASPMVGNILDINSDVKTYPFDLDQANKLLNPERSREGSQRASTSYGMNGKKIDLKLTTSTWPELVAVANALKEQWAKVGVNIEVEILPTPELQRAIKERNYQMLLFGEILTLDPDPFTLWHSSQRRDPGLNLALYSNKTADTLLEEARKILNPLERAQKYDEFQKLVIEDAPAVFLYNSYYIYGQTKDIRGFESKIISMPSDRFANIEKWYMETKRGWE
ncbi:MAG: hypothetical protein HYT67_00160 [Candidatus Yanofskybacteria bacterium]|nr:hypothetical protein [Candidatus Yanofskybacteria bacterium]